MPTDLDHLLTFLRFPSVSTDPARRGDMEACAKWLTSHLEGIGMQAELRPTDGNPVALARNQHRPGRPTVLLYGHYDVQPEDPLELWQSPPFEPEIRDGVIYARGATDNKGQLMAHVRGIAATLAEHGDLPVNLICLFEGEEEIGSPNLEPFIAAHRDELQCDLVAVSDTGMLAPGVGTLTYGLRGIACLELRVTGPSSDLHSGIFGGAVANPATAVARLVASLHDADQRIQIEGFYDDVRPLEDWEREAWATLPIPEGETLALTGAPELCGEAGYTELEQRWARPTAEVNGIGGGYQGAGSKTVLPSKAFAKISFRLVPDQKPGVILDLARRHFERHAPPGVTVEIVPGHTGQAYLLDPRGEAGAAARRALGRAFPGDTALIREGGSIPIVQTFKDLLDADTLLLGLALPDARAHAPNENFPVASFEGGIRLNRCLLEELAG